MSRNIETICIFCSANKTLAKHYFQMGREFGKALVDKKIRLVYGGNSEGLMGGVADSVLQFGGEVIGIFPSNLENIEQKHQSLTELIIVNDLQERKRKMVEHSDAIVILPGGFGTMDELFEVIIDKQLRFHNKPIIIFNYQGYWDPLVNLMENIIENGFAQPETRNFYQVVDSIEAIFTFF